ncbi:MAG: protein kinase domain-containing protein [Thermoanaerobaculia bacterium]
MTGTGRESREHFIGPYRILAPLGEGGMGVVYLGIHDHLRREVAIKALAPELTRHPEFAERFFIEARTQARLQHTNIVTIYDLIEEEGSFFIVMEHVPGDTLEALLTKRNRESWDLAHSLRLFQQILAGLDYAHSKGVIHRDVKPSNVMIADSDLVKLTDFGIALLVGDKRLTASHSTVGTPIYMSPEQILRPRSVDHRTDIYSAAVVLFEMLAGRPPFDAETEYEIKKLQVETPAPDLREVNPGIPERMAHALTVALRKDPEERFPSAGAFARALSAEPAPTPSFRVSAQAEPAPSSLAATKPASEGSPATSPPRLRDRRVMAAVAVGLLLIALPVIFHLTFYREDSSRSATSPRQPVLALPTPLRPAEVRVPVLSPSTVRNALERAPMSKASPQPPVKRLITPTPGDRQPTPSVRETRVNKAADRAAATEKTPRGTEIPPPAGMAHRKIEAKDSPEAVQIPPAAAEHAWEDKLRWAHEVIANKNYVGARAIAQSLLDAPDLPAPIAVEARALIEESRNLESASQRAKPTFRIERVELLSERVQRGSRIIAVVHVTVEPPLERPLVVTIRAQIFKDQNSISSPIQQEVTLPTSSPSLRVRIPIEVPVQLHAGDYYIQAGLWNTANAIQSLGRIRFKIP